MSYMPIVLPAPSRFGEAQASQPAQAGSSREALKSFSMIAGAAAVVGIAAFLLMRRRGRSSEFLPIRGEFVTRRLPTDGLMRNPARERPERIEYGDRWEVVR